MNAPRKLRRGRPKLDAAQALRAKACWLWVHAKTGLGLADWEARLYPESVCEVAGKIERPRIWDRYMAGTMCPSDTTAEKVERVLPGFRGFYAHPFWRTLLPDGLTREESIELMRTLTSLEDWLFQLLPLVRHGITLGPYDPPLRRIFDDHVFQRLVAIGTLESATAFLAMVHEAEGLGNPDYRERAMTGFRCHVPMIRKLPEFEGIANEITDLVDKRIGDYLIFGNQKFRVHVFTKNLTDEDLTRGFEFDAAGGAGLQRE